MDDREFCLDLVTERSEGGHVFLQLVASQDTELVDKVNRQQKAQGSDTTIVIWRDIKDR